MGAPYRIVDLGERRVLAVDGREYPTYYSERVIRMLIERKGVHRAPLYFPFKETRGRHFLGPLFRYLDGQGFRDLAVLEVGCSFGHITEYLAEQPAVARIVSFDTDPAFVAIVRTKVDEMRLTKVRDIAHLGNDATRRLPWADGAFARDPLGRAAARAVALAAARVALRARRPAGPLSPRDLRGLRRRRDGLAERDARRLLARVGLAGPARRHRGGGLRLALLP